MNGNHALLVAALFAFVAVPGRVKSEEMSTGIRIGRNLQEKRKSFTQYDVYMKTKLPYSFGIAEGVVISPSMDVASGVLVNEDRAAEQKPSRRIKDKVGFIGSIGPSIGVSSVDEGVGIDGGIRGALLSTYEFMSRNLGGPFLFVLHGGLNYNRMPFSLAYRFQHMSNAWMYHLNPGLNLHMIEFAYRY